MADDDIEYYGPCGHCGTVLWILPHHQIAPGQSTLDQRFELPNGLGWLTLADEFGFALCPVCSCAVSVAPVSLN